MSANTNPPRTKVEDLPPPRKSRRGGYRQTPPEKLCAYKTSEGTPCRAAKMPNSNFCIAHDFAAREARAQAFETQARLARSEDLSTVEGLHSLMRSTVEGMQNGRIAPNVANSIGYLAQVMLSQLPHLHRERKEKDPNNKPLVELEKRLKQIVADQILDDQEQIIRKLKKNGQSAWPLDAAEKFTEELRRKLAESQQTQNPQTDSPEKAAPEDDPDV
jgi:hypothetical protein